MIVIRATKNLLKELKINPTGIDISDPFFSWHTNIFMLNRRKCIVFMNDLSRLSLMVTGIRSTQYKNLNDIFFKELRHYLLSEGIDERLIESYLNNGKEMIITSTNNRSVISTMNEIVLVSKEIHKEFANMNDRNKWNNTFIYKPIDYAQPIDVFRKQLVKQF
ncbi:DUF6933 domain-containing protein [Paenibacillus piri]|uniref:DUF6933 domain-containing protein n=1 Tax=Paenibacillus piri TaxID=2547395 RepID=UPI0014049A9E|nr:hypothetical protein [Paenibacillus piri]